MAISERLEFLLTADPSQMVTALGRVGEASQNSLSQVESNVAKIGATFAKVGAAGVGLGGLLTVAASGDIEAANQLKAAIESVGESYDNYRRRIEATAQEQVKFGHTDEEVNGALATLTLSYNDAGKALDQMQLVADLAARKHISLADAATAVARAHGGAGRLFKEFGIEVSANANGTKDYDAALGQLAEKLRGQASASADSFGGRLRALKAEAENLFSEFGQNYGPLILGLSTGFTVLGSATSAFSGVLTKLRAARAADITETEGQIAANASLAASEEGATIASGGLFAALGPAGLVAGTVAAVGGILYLASTQEDATAVTADYTEALKATGDELTSNVDKVTATALATNKLVLEAKDAGLSLADLFSAVRDGDFDFEKLQQTLGRDIFKQPGDHSRELAAALKDAGIESTQFGRDLEDLAGQGKLSAEQIQGLLVIVYRLQSGYIDQKEAQEELTAAMAATGDATGSTTQGMKDQKDVLNDLKDAANDAKSAYDSLVQARRGLLSAEIRAASGEDNIAAANQRVADAQAKLGTGQTAEENARLQRDYNDAVRDAQSAANDYAQASAELAEKQDKANGVTRDAQYYTDLYASDLHSIADSLTSGDVHKGLEQYIADLDATADAEAAARQAALERAAAAGDAKAQQELSDQRRQSQQSSGDYLTGGHFAAGGATKPGYRIAGEFGPELQFTDPTGYGYVWNTSATSAMLNLGGSSTSNWSPTLNIYGTDNPRRAADEGYLALRRLSMASGM